MYTFKIGTDPELFVMKDGKFISGHDLIPGTKHQPFLVPGGAVQVDGVACEFNTFPVQTADDFVQVINDVRSKLTEMVKSHDPAFELVSIPTAVFDEEYFWNLPDQAILLGCTPDFNAYTGKENDTPSTEETFRTGAGHIHVGWGHGFDVNSDEHFELCRKVVRQLDCILYPISLLWDSDDKRRTLYGKIGAFRPKHYGVEYRPLSNAYLSDERVIRWVFDATMWAVDILMNSGVDLFEEDSGTRNLVQMINDGYAPSNFKVEDHLDVLHDYGCPLFPDGVIYKNEVGKEKAA